MSKKKHTPKHRQAKHRAERRATLGPALRNGAVVTTVAVATTGAAVGGGMVFTAPPEAPAVAHLAGSGAASLGDGALEGVDGTATSAADDAELEALAERREVVSRSETRSATDPTKAVALAAEAGEAVVVSEDASDRDPRELGRMLLGEFGFGDDQWSCLDSLWTKESNWQTTAANPTSSAYGIPQSLPGTKMATVADDWQTNPVTQIRWGLGYIQDRYGTPCAAWGHSQANNWY